jgi:hypothetical protein
MWLMVNGKLHRLLPVHVSQPSRNFLVAFDTQKEKFMLLHTPEVERLFAYQVFEPVNGGLEMAVGSETMSSVNIWLLACCKVKMMIMRPGLALTK